MKKYLSILLVLISFSACRVSLVPAYDADIVKQISFTAKAADKLLLQVSEEEGKARSYSAFKEKYIDVQVELNDLLRMEMDREKNDELVKITSNIIDQFGKYKARHKEEDAAIKNAVLELERDYLNDHFQILLKAEKALR